MYKVKNFISRDSESLQIRFKAWLQSREHITVVDTNIWTDTDYVYGTIVYIENDYIG